MPGIPSPTTNWLGSSVSKKKKSSDKKKKSSGGGSMLSSLGKSNVGSMAEAIERQANSQAQQARQKSGLTSTNPIEQMMSDFMSQYNSIDVAPTPLEQLQKLAEQQVGAQFDPMIDLLSQQMTSKTGRANKSMNEARDMYGALSKDFLSQIPELTQQFAAEDKEANQRYDSAQAELQKQYGNQSKEQQAVLQQLGIQAAAPEASQQARDDQAYFQGQMETDQQAALSALNEQQRAQQDYQSNLGNTTRVAGENTAQDIRGMLEDYLDQANTQMTGLQSQRGSALQSLLQQMQSQDAGRIEKEEQQQFENLLAMSRLQLDAAKAAGSGSGASGAEGLFKGTSGLSGAQNFLAQQYPESPIIAGNLMEQLNDVLSNKQVTQGKYQLEPGDPSTGKAARYSDVGQEYMMDLLRNEIEKENQSQPGRYGSGDINNAINALLAYLGKLR